MLLPLLMIAPAKAPIDGIAQAIREVFLRCHLPFKAAAADMEMPQSNLSRSLAEFGPSVARLAMLPDAVKRQLWYALRPFFGFSDEQPSDVDVADLKRRVLELEASVRRLQPASTTPHDNERRTA